MTPVDREDFRNGEHRRRSVDALRHPTRSIATALRLQLPAPIKADSEAVPGIDSKSPSAAGVVSKPHATGSNREDAFRPKSALERVVPMIHVERAKKNARELPRASLCSTWNRADVRDAAA